MDIYADLLPILIPFLIIELGLRIFALLSVLKAKKNGVSLRWDPIIWIIIVCFITFGWVIYFIFGRTDE
jgi:hypothetical protein